MTAALVAVVVALSVSAGWGWRQVQSGQESQDFRHNAGSVAASIAAALKGDLDIEATLQRYIEAHPGVSNRELAPWLSRLDLAGRYPGTKGFGLVEQVPAADLAAFTRLVEADPPVGGVPQKLTVVPAGDRPTYCLTHLGVTLGSTGLPAGLDMCAPELDGVGRSPLPGLLQQSSEASSPVVVGVMDEATRGTSLAPGVYQQMDRTLGDVFLVVSRVRPAGISPSPAEWLVGTFNIKTLIEQAAAGQHGLDIAVATSQGSVLGSEGGPIRHGRLRSTVAAGQQPGLRVTVTGPASSDPTTEGLMVGLLVGAALGSMVVLIRVLARSRQRALALVEERTGQLRHQALHDALTGLPNRALLSDRAEQMLARAQRHGYSVGALFLDLDNFKGVNDSLGHNVGDELLKAVADRLRSVVRASDTVGRLGGDEFLILIDAETVALGPERLAERILAVASEPYDLAAPHPVTLNTNVSIGIACGPRATAEELIRDADVALYKAKEAGKGRYALFRPEMQVAAHDRLRLEMDLARAIPENQLFVQYQPIFDLATMTTTGVEALVRWRHGERGVVPPAAFIPIAEQSGLISDIGRFVLHQACHQGAEWHKAGYRISMSVNVSASQLLQGDFAADVRAALGSSGLDASYLTLELTESTLMHDTEATACVLHELKEMGARIAIDDFGTGYSSLAYLRQFPIDSIKIDRSFIAKAGRSRHGGALIHTLVQLGKDLGIETLAEGIEDHSQLSRLQQEKCDSGQGFLFARPVDAEELTGFLAETVAPGPDAVRALSL